MRLVLTSLAVWLSAMLALQAEEARILPAEVAANLNLWVEEHVGDEVFEMLALDREKLRTAIADAATTLEAAECFGTRPNRSDADQLLGTLASFEATAPFSDQLRTLLNAHEPAQSPSLVIPEPTNPRAPEELFKRWLAIVTHRGQPAAASDYLPRLKPIFQSERIPVELVWLAEVESAFDPHAESPAGAVGLFQLMPNTAKGLGLSTWLPDDRRDPERNTQAAARYLRQLHERFANWQLALAAYNAGPTRVGKLLKQSETQSYAAIAPHLPSETQDYVAKVRATLRVREGIELASLDRGSLYLNASADASTSQ